MPSILGLHRSPVLRRLVQGSAAFLLSAVPAVAQTQLWIDQFGGALGDTARAALSDGTGGVFLCGWVNGHPEGWYGGRDDVLLTRIDSTGGQLWTQTLSTPGFERALAMASDGAGGFFVVGQLDGPFGGPATGFTDSWLARFDASGTRLWFKNLGAWARLLTAAPDGSGGVYLAGNTLGLVDAWVGRFDSTGNQLWSVTTYGDWYDFQSATPDGAGGVYVCGSKSKSGPSGLDIQGGLARYDSAGNQVWNKEFGSSSVWNEANAALSDGTGGVFVGGINGNTAWIARYDGSGAQQWIQSAGQGQPAALAPDLSGGLYVSIGFGSGGVMVKRLDATGNFLWSHKAISSGGNFLGPVMPWALASDGASGFFIGGSTAKDLSGTNAGGTDAWFARYDGSCNSGTTYCVASTTSIPGCAASINATGSPTLSNPTAWTVSSGPVPGANLGLLLFGSSGKDNTPYGTLGGKLCVAAPTVRTAPKTSGGDQGQCNGSYAFTLADLIAASPIVTSGATVNAQAWARDPANQDEFLLSNGIEFTVCP
jgi:hypothetical protein